MKHLVVLLISFVFITSCNSDYEEEPTTNAEIYGELNERKMMCGLRKIVPSTNLEGAYECVYNHPHSEIDDRVTVGQSWMCPNEIYCDKR